MYRCNENFNKIIQVTYLKIIEDREEKQEEIWRDHTSVPNKLLR